MAENKKDKSAELARDKSAFAKGGSEKGTASQKVQHKYSGTHQPRDANDISRDVQKKEQSEPFGQNVQKSGQSAHTLLFLSFHQRHAQRNTPFS